MVEWDVHLPVAAQPTIDAVVDLGEHAESAGYDRVWMPETWGRDAVSILATLSERTETIGLGTSVVNVYSRSPAVLAQTAVTLDEASGGRFRLGIGPSGPAVIERWHGLSYDRPLRRTREATEIARTIMRGEVVEYAGDIFSLEGFRLRCDPPAEPVPIDLAGLGPKAVELAGFVGDGWHALLGTPEGIERRLDDFATGRTKGGRSHDDARVTVGLPCCVLDDESRARTLVREHLAFYIGAMGPFYARTLIEQGFETTVEQVMMATDAGDRRAAADAIDDAVLDRLAAAGTADTAMSALDQFRTIEGVDAIAVSFPRGATRDEIIATIDALAP